MYQLELAQSGKRLFKIRGNYLVTIIIIGSVIAYLNRSTGPFDTVSANQAWFWISFFVAALGAFIRIITSGYAALGTSGNIKDQAVAAELNTTGPYSLVRNPLYVGRILNFTGIAMLSGSWVFGVMTFLISVLIYERISVYEEEFLRKEFVNAHAEWAKKVPFLLPRLKGWVNPKYNFWFRRMVMREDTKIYWLVTAVVLNHYARLGFDITQITENLTLLYVWVVATLVVTSIRALIYLTRLFDGIS
jgi:protein-S-isoprenylcysteine O-methyltransferase Ste14